MKTLYTAHATAIGGRGGHAETDDKSFAVKLARPGTGDQGVNPEQLFAIGYGACFGGAVEAVARKMQVKAGEVKIHADVSLNQDDAGNFQIGAVLDVSIAGVDDATAMKVVEAAHQMCPYSRATRGNIEVVLKVSGQPLKAAA